MLSQSTELRCRRTGIEPASGLVFPGGKESVRIRRTQWKSRRLLHSRHSRLGAFLDTCVTAGLSVPTKDSGLSKEPLGWILEPLRVQGYFKIQLSEDEHRLIQHLFECSRNFFAQPMPYKTSFKFFPIPGGYLTPYPGANETFELRRGLCRCPSELAGQAMSAFQLLERLGKAVCREVGRDIGVNLESMPSDVSATLRCIHYDEPHKSVGLVDETAPADFPLSEGSMVRIVHLEGADHVLNGQQGAVTFSGKEYAMVNISSAPVAVLKLVNVIEGCIRVERANLRLLRPDARGVYPAHTDSSLVTIAPRSSAAGLEAKDLQTGEWFRIEEHMRLDEVLVFVGDPLDYASAHRYRALMHRPVVPALGGAIPPITTADGRVEHRISTPFFLYPRDTATLAPGNLLPTLTFDSIQGNEGGCRDNFPWKKQSCYYSDMVYS